MRYNEISHFSHPQHKLKFECTEALFKCDGCREFGIGSCYKCATCDFDLHLHCALPSPTLSHPFYTKCSFQFCPRPPGTVARYCNACEKDVTGFVYHCKPCGFDLHPCCAKLPMVLDDGDVKLYLYRKVRRSCRRCGRKGRSWSYRSGCKNYHLHVACVKEMLVESWHDHQISRGINGNRNINIGGGGNGIGGGGGGGGGRLETRIPNLKGTTLQKRSGKGKVKRCFEMARLVVQFVVAAVLGDPITLIAGVLGALFSK